jgi:DNA-binding NarL/FixJ family response regulator
MSGSNRLTRQERSVLSLVAEGRRNAAIAQKLSISTRTVENHLYHSFDQLGVSSRTKAALHALHTGMIGFQAE